MERNAAIFWLLRRLIGVKCWQRISQAATWAAVCMERHPIALKRLEQEIKHQSDLIRTVSQSGGHFHLKGVSRMNWVSEKRYFEAKQDDSRV